VGFRNRLGVLWSWGWNYLRKDRAIRIIARSADDPVADTVEGLAAPPAGGADARGAARPDPLAIIGK